MPNQAMFAFCLAAFLLCSSGVEGRCDLNQQEVCSSQKCLAQFRDYKQFLTNGQQNLAFQLRQGVIDQLGQIDCAARPASDCTTLFLGTTNADGNYLVRANTRGFPGHEGITCSLVGESKASWVAILLDFMTNAVMSLDRLRPAAAAKKAYTTWDDLNKIIEGCKEWMDNTNMGGATCAEIFYVLCHKKKLNVRVEINAANQNFVSPLGTCADIYAALKPTVDQWVGNDGVREGSIMMFVTRNDKDTITLR